MVKVLEDRVEIDPLLKQITELEEQGKAHTPEYEELCLIYKEIGEQGPYTRIALLGL